MGKKILKFLLLIVLLGATTFGSYKGVIALWGEDELTSVTTQAQGTGSAEKKGQKVKKNVVTAYYYDNYTKGILEYAVVRIFNANTKESNYIFFTEDSKIHLSDRTYQSLLAASTNVKQDTYIKDISACFAQDEDRYNYTAEALEDVIGTKIDYYEAITSDNIISIVNLMNGFYFDVPKKMKFKDDSNIDIILKKGSQALMGDQVKGMLTNSELYGSELERLQVAEQYIKAYLDAVSLLDDRDAMDSYYRKYYQLVNTNGGYDKMLAYMDYFYQISPANIVMTTAPGKQVKDGYSVDSDKLKKIVASYLSKTVSEGTSTPENVTETPVAETETTEEPSEDTTEESTEEESTEESTEEATEQEPATADSKDLKIEIYNSTTINGLAAKWKGKLEGEGYKISATETERSYHLNDCVIYVSEKGQGQDLLQYFPNAEIKVGTLTKADIRIVLGLNDKKVR